MELDPSGGGNYTDMGVSQLLSVPYALFAQTSGNSSQTGFYSIGQQTQGGVVFWIDSTNQHGLVAAVSDQASSVTWYDTAYATTNAVRDGLYAGKSNTDHITINQGAGNYAAQVCAIYQGGGYGDWYLPSTSELNLLYLQSNAVGGFSAGIYWSSTEVGNNFAGTISFVNGASAQGDKSGANNVRAIRAF